MASHATDVVDLEEKVDQLVGLTGDSIIGEGFTPLQTYTWSTYREALRTEAIAPIKGMPKNIPASARFGSLRLAGRLLPFLAYESDKRGYEVIVDLDDDGDLRGEERLLPDVQQHLLQVDVPYEFPLRLQIPVTRDGVLGNMVFQYTDTYRHGLIRLDNKPIRFAVGGREGRYGHPWNSVAFDLNEDGVVDTNLDSDERFLVRERYVNLEGRSYSFDISSNGSRLSLKALEEHRLRRASLAPGNLAPDFSFTDLEGAGQRLFDFRGRYVLLYGWATSCGACRKVLPDLLRLRSELVGCDFDVIGINRDVSIVAALEYIESEGLLWANVLDGENGPISDFYRIIGTPFFSLIDRDGMIVMREFGEAGVIERLRTELKARACSEAVCDVFGE